MNEKNSEKIYFSDLEGMRIAISMEERGQAFYKKACGLSEKKEHKELFAKLAEEEAEHLRKFTEIYHELKGKKQASADDYLFDTDTSMYLAALSSPDIFTDEEAEEIKDSDKSVAQLLRRAMQDEKEAILFYDALAKNSKFEEARKIFSALKAEEQAHIVRLREMLLTWG